jgi:hypothetical protein
MIERNTAHVGVVIPFRLTLTEHSRHRIKSREAMLGPVS